MASPTSRMNLEFMVWLIPVGAGPAEVRRSQELLQRRQAQAEVIDFEALRGLLNHHRPGAAIVLGGPVSADLLDAQRWLEEFRVATMVVVDDLTPHFEATLLERGAQDVVSSSTPVRILAARLEALLRHASGWLIEPAPSVPRLHIDPESRSVHLGTQQVDLTRAEFDLLLTLTGRPGVFVTRGTLAIELQEQTISRRALESRVSRLRRKLRAHGAGEMVETVRSVGYRFNPEGTSGPPDLHPGFGDEHRRAPSPS
ncbi:winged helix-turn-helix domain-containing protein [Serinicoccus hydrothermalis]|nr:winged helix-turn-helix domain-containing protein [Serinicoccus hydrothermalis]